LEVKILTSFLDSGGGRLDNALPMALLFPNRGVGDGTPNPIAKNRGLNKAGANPATNDLSLILINLPCEMTQ